MLIPIIKESERLFEERMHKYICNCVIKKIDNCPRVAKVKAEFVSSQLALLEGLKKEVEGMMLNVMSDVERCQAFSDQCGKKGEDGKYLCYYCQIWKGQQRETLSVKSEITNSALSQVIQSLEESITYLKSIK